MPRMLRTGLTIAAGNTPRDDITAPAPAPAPAASRRPHNTKKPLPFGRGFIKTQAVTEQ